MIKMIFAVGPNNEFGAGNELPWKHVREDMLHFMKYTEGSIVIMGRKTWESLPEQKLPGRPCIVVTSSPVEGEACVSSLPEALKMAETLNNMVGVNNDICIIGGTRLLKEAAHLVEEVSMSRICNSAMRAPAWDTPTTYLDLDEITDALNHKGLVDLESHLLPAGTLVTIFKKE